MLKTATSIGGKKNQGLAINSEVIQKTAFRKPLTGQITNARMANSTTCCRTARRSRTQWKSFLKQWNKRLFEDVLNVVGILKEIRSVNISILFYRPQREQSKTMKKKKKKKPYNNVRAAWTPPLILFRGQQMSKNSTYFENENTNCYLLRQANEGQI